MMTVVVIEDAAPTDIVMTFDESVDGTNLGFTIAGTTSSTFASISGSGNTWTGVLADPAAFGETITLSYSQATGDFVDLADTPNELEDITNKAVTNSISDGVSYGLENATYSGNTLTPTPAVRTISIANGDVYLGTGSGTFEQWNLDNNDVTAWTTQSNIGTGYLNNTTDFGWKADGTKLYLTFGDARIFQYLITTAWDPTARSTRTDVTITGITGGLRTWTKDPTDTTWIFAGQTGNTLHQWTASTPGEISSLADDSVSLTIDINADYISALAWSIDGHVLLVGDGEDALIRQVDCPNAYSLVGATNSANTLSTSAEGAGLIYSIEYNETGTAIFVVDYIDNDIQQYNLNN